MPYHAHGMRRSQRTRSQDLPPVDERAVMPESGVELLEGKALIVPGADPPHATRHLELAYVLRAHVAPGFTAAIDMLTRTSVTSDFAPDASIYPDGPDAETGGRRLEVLAFEVVSKQSLSIPTRKARQLARRGVRRIFALVLKRERVLEWDHRLGRWAPMHPDESIEDVCFVRPFPVRTLIETAGADAAVMAALEARRPDLVALVEARGEARGEVRGEARGRLEGERRAIELVCGLLGIEIDASRAAHLVGADLAELRRISDALARARAWPDPG